MTQIINLNRVRKDKARADRRKQADANAAKHGRTKAERLRDEAEAERQSRSLDRHRRDDD